MKDLTQGSVIKQLLHMSAFLAASMLVQTLYLLADLYWVGHLGKEAIAAVGVAGNLTMIVLALTQMLGVGTTTLISQAAGRTDQPRAEVVFNQSFVMSIVIAFGLGIVGFILRDALRHHPRLWTSGTGRSRDAGAVLAGDGVELCCCAGSGTELRRSPRRRGPAFCLFRDRDRIVDDARAYADCVFRTCDADSHFLKRRASDCLRQRIPADRVIEFHLGRNRLCNIKRVPGDREHTAASV
jgi:hypothetical protein